MRQEQRSIPYTKMGGQFSEQYNLPAPTESFSKHNYINESQLRSVERTGFSQSSSSDRLTDEQMEDLIAENIYDWWISGKSYKKWYTDKFLQLKFDLSEDNETQTSEENNGMV